MANKYVRSFSTMPKDDTLRVVMANSLGVHPEGKYLDAATVKERLDSSNTGFNHSVVVSSNGAIVITARVGRQLRDYLSSAVKSETSDILSD